MVSNKTKKKLPFKIVCGVTTESRNASIFYKNFEEQIEETSATRNSQRSKDSLIMYFYLKV